MEIKRIKREINKKIKNELNIVFNKLEIKDKEIKKKINDYNKINYIYDIEYFFIDIYKNRDKIKNKKDIEQYYIIFNLYIKEYHKIKTYQIFENRLQKFIYTFGLYDYYIYLQKIIKKIYNFK